MKTGAREKEEIDRQPPFSETALCRIFSDAKVIKEFSTLKNAERCGPS